MAGMPPARQPRSLAQGFPLAAAIIMVACGGHATEGVTVSPTPLTPPSSSLLSISIPNAVTGGLSAAGTVTLNSAPAADTSITLASDNPSVFVSTVARVNSRFPTADFVVSTPVVARDTTVTITATVDNLSA